MESVDADISRLVANPAVSAVSEHIDTASGVLQSITGTTESLGSYVQI